MQVKVLDDLITLAKNNPRKRLVVAYGQDPNTIGAVQAAAEMNIVDVTLVGDLEKIHALCKERSIDPEIFEIAHEPDEQEAGNTAVRMVNEGKADFIMKGLISTDKYMRSILNKEYGLLSPGAILSHISVVEVPAYHKLLIIGDVAVIPEPDLNQKIAITKYLIAAAHAIGIEKPKVAIVAATEKANPKMKACVDASIISKMADRGQIKGAFVDGPLALDAAIDPESCEIKGITGDVAGDADCLVFPDIESGNIFYKSMTKLANSELAAIVTGANKPAILSSRGDSEKTKLYSITLAAIMS